MDFIGFQQDPYDVPWVGGWGRGWGGGGATIMYMESLAIQDGPLKKSAEKNGYMEVKMDEELNNGRHVDRKTEENMCICEANEIVMVHEARITMQFLLPMWLDGQARYVSQRQG